MPDDEGLGVIPPAADRERSATLPAVTNSNRRGRASQPDILGHSEPSPYMKQLHNALCHPAAIVPKAVETSHYKSHIQAPFTTYGTSVMLASESSRRRTCSPRAATLSH